MKVYTSNIFLTAIKTTYCPGKISFSFRGYLPLIYLLSSEFRFLIRGYLPLSRQITILLSWILATFLHYIMIGYYYDTRLYI